LIECGICPYQQIEDGTQVRLYSFLIGKPGYFYFVVPRCFAMRFVIPTEIVEQEPAARPEEPFCQDDSEPVGTPVLGAIQEDEVVFRLGRSGGIKALLDFRLQEPGVRGKPLIKSHPVAKPGLFQYFPRRRVKPLPAG
jgi:hypothetical protein